MRLQYHYVVAWAGQFRVGGDGGGASNVGRAMGMPGAAQIIAQGEPRELGGL